MRKLAAKIDPCMRHVAQLSQHGRDVKRLGCRHPASSPEPDGSTRWHWCAECQDAARRWMSGEVPEARWNALRSPEDWFKELAR